MDAVPIAKTTKEGVLIAIHASRDRQLRAAERFAMHCATCCWDHIWGTVIARDSSTDGVWIAGTIGDARGVQRTDRVEVPALYVGAPVITTVEKINATLADRCAPFPWVAYLFEANPIVSKDHMTLLLRIESRPDSA
jgi:hypothetical protein